MSESQKSREVRKSKTNELADFPSSGLAQTKKPQTQHPWLLNIMCN
jgi:hypothetical protein